MLGTPLLLSGTLAFVLMVSTASGATGDANYFLLSSRMVGSSLGSCVLPLTKPEDIAEARRQMTLGQLSLIPVMHIAAGADGINRDYLAPGKPAWTWHVTEFIGFAEGIIEVYETTPVLIERRVGGWRNETNGTAGLTGYRPVAELTLEQIFFTSASLTAEGVRLHWLDLGTNYAYTVETSDTVGPPGWMPAAGGSWPIAATNWTDTTLVAAGPRFYRVKAERKLSP